MDPASAFVWSAPIPRDALRQNIGRHWLADESALVAGLLQQVQIPALEAEAICAVAATWVRAVRAGRGDRSPLDAFMEQYDLSSEEGVLLMCLAEALLRIPDDDTAEKLIADKLGSADWERHLGRSDSVFVNASTWGLMLTGKVLRLPPETQGSVRTVLARLVNRSSEPVIRLAIRQAMKMMGRQFVMGRSIEEAIAESRSRAQRGDLHSFDMLGEAALTAEDAQRYLQAYQHAIGALGAANHATVQAPVMSRPGISVKLSALHPRYEFAQRERVLSELAPRLLLLAQQARHENIGLTVDAEEADRLELSLDLIERVFPNPTLDGWEGLGLVVQAYQKRALPVIDWLEHLARSTGRRLAVRLVKGAYWDTEIKRSQEQGLPGYPVYTRKAHTDLSYLACARRLLSARDAFYPQFATHNAHTLAAVRAYVTDQSGYECQRLHGMGQPLYEVARASHAVPTRVYAPVGSHEDLLPYLVRRLLENGANSSFVNGIFDDRISPEALVADPAQGVAAQEPPGQIGVALPRDLYGATRRNSAGFNMADEQALLPLYEALNLQGAVLQMATSVTARTPSPDAAEPPRVVIDPADRNRTLGHWQPLNPAAVPGLMEDAVSAQPSWAALPVEQRARMLERAADALEAEPHRALWLLVREAGKTLPDAVAELREAVDFLRYYAQQARTLMAAPVLLPGPTGEHNELQLHAKGVFVCISPWNFPLAIFTGQIAAALVTGNAVIAKPAEQTNLIAVEMLGLLHRSGVPRAVLQAALGEGNVGAALTAQAMVAGVAFTGSVEVAQAINRSLAARSGPIATLIAETGGQNAMIVDSSALPEQVVRDVMLSAFSSAGQRCSALRVLFLQDDIADKVIHMLRGAMQQWRLGNPGLLSTDVGPLIDDAARLRLQAHAADMASSGRLIAEVPVAADLRDGRYFAPRAFEIDSLARLDSEYFGPFLHVLRYRGEDIDSVIEQINRLGYGLTLGVHSRVETTWRAVQRQARVGNCYVNRGMTGAVVGVQPFGGEGLSGTGPKAGGPNYLLRFVNERTLTVNTAAVGGNAGLLAQAR